MATPTRPATKNPTKPEKEAMSYPDSEPHRVLMNESYEGQVVSVDGDEVVVVYEISDDLVEQTYQRDQFIGGLLPEVGQRLATVVTVAVLEPKSPEDTDPEEGLGDDATDNPRDRITGPMVF